MLLGPVAEQLGTKRLLIVAEGALQYLPFGALPKPRLQGSKGERGKSRRARTRDKRSRAATEEGIRPLTPLIVDHEIVTLPSASVMAVLRREISRSTKQPSKAVAVMADPVFETDDPRLASEALTRRLRDTEQANKRRPRFTEHWYQPYGIAVPQSSVSRTVRRVAASLRAPL